MSSSSNFNFSSSTSYSTSTTTNGQTTGSQYTQQSTGNPQGTTVHTTSQNLGEDPVNETRQYDAQGRELLSGGTNQPVIQDVTDADKKYEEAIEDEYAKREGGA
ncbi:hypothetical protein BDZ85DRAFT_231440 [Elsinoe ampelina]|uniref:Uncharacterized protein n=2 Tax=Elsinoe TaxID=40996 RepID=A0A8K0LC90_9PEZI|nr:hypothetical protein BDZ85DRAFT_231440 [Elsinoe ampelina]KAG8631405.1 hypothetical protein KVT40_000545 [Elsinoe batatas]